MSAAAVNASEKVAGSSLRSDPRTPSCYVRLLAKNKSPTRCGQKAAVGDLCRVETMSSIDPRFSPVRTGGRGVLPGRCRRSRSRVPLSSIAMFQCPTVVVGIPFGIPFNSDLPAVGNGTHGVRSAARPRRALHALRARSLRPAPEIPGPLSPVHRARSVRHEAAPRAMVTRFPAIRRISMVMLSPT